MGIPVLFMLGILALWAVASGRATNFITALTGGQSTQQGNVFGQPPSGQITPNGQQFPGVAEDNITPIGMPNSFTSYNRNALPMVPPYIVSG